MLHFPRFQSLLSTLPSLICIVLFRLQQTPHTSPPFYFLQPSLYFFTPSSNSTHPSLAISFYLISIILSALYCSPAKLHEFHLSHISLSLFSALFPTFVEVHISCLHITLLLFHPISIHLSNLFFSLVKLHQFHLSHIFLSLFDCTVFHLRLTPPIFPLSHDPHFQLLF